MTLNRSKAFVSLLFGGTMLAGVAQAQEQTLAGAPPPRIPTDAHGVNVITGNYNRADALLSVGSPGVGAISVTRDTVEGQTHDSYVGVIQTDGAGGYVVNIGSSSETFNGSLQNTSGTNSTLAYNTSNHIGVYTTGDGTAYNFITAPGPSYVSAYYSYAASVLSTIKHTDGQVDTYNYETPQFCTGGQQNATPAGSSSSSSSSTQTGAQPQATTCTNVYRLKSITSSTGYEIDLAYADAGTLVNRPHFQLSTISSPQGGSVSFVVGTTTTTINDGFVTRTYNYAGPNGRLSSLQVGTTSPVTTTIGYDANNRISSWSDGVANYSYTYSDAANGAVTQRTTTVGGPSGNKTYISDATNLLVNQYSDEKGQATKFVYDGSYRLMSVTRPEGDQTTYSYTTDGRNNVRTATSVPKPNSGLASLTTTYGYACQNALSCNKPTSVVDPKGFETDYTYNASNGQVASVTSPAPASSGTRPQTRYTYVELNTGSADIWRLTATSSCTTAASCAGSSDEIKTAIQYGTSPASTHFLPVQVTSAFGDGTSANTVNLTYNAVGDLLTSDGPAPGTGRTTRYVYGAARQLTGVIGPDPDGGGPLHFRAARYTYNDSGERVTAEQGTTTGQADSDFSNFSSLVTVKSAFNVQGLKTLDQLVVGGTVRRSYQYGYNTRGFPQCTAVRLSTDPTSYPSACATSSNSASERITQQGYDAVGNRTLIIEAVGTNQAANTFQATFGADNEQLTTTDANNNTTNFGYDGFNRLTAVTFPAVGSLPTTESYAYDANSNRTSLVRRGGATLTYAYDNLNRLTGVSQPNTTGYANYTYGYDNLSRLRSSSSTQGVSTAYAYDAQGRVTIENNPLGNVSSTYDAAGNRVRLTWPDGFYVVYDYDLTGAMTAVRESGATSGAGVLAQISYDDQGRRTSITRGNGSSTSYAYSSAQLLTTLTHSIPASGQSETENYYYNIENQVIQTVKSNDGWAWTNAYNFDRAYTANALNEQTQSGSSNLTWGSKGTLTADSGSGTTYAYDINNKLFSVSTGSTLTYDSAGRVYSAGSGGSTRFSYDGGLAIAEYNSSGTLTQRYVPGPGVDEPLAWYNNGSRMTLMADRQGSVAGVVNDSGALAALNSYDEYGLPGTGNAGRYQYTGQKYMSEFGWYDYKARNYSMTLGRFVQPDPSGFAGGSNLYEYAGSSPTTFTDPLGLAPGGAGLDTIAIDPCAGIEGCSNVEVTGQRLVDGALNPGLVSTIVKDAGTEGAGPAGSMPQNVGKPPPPCIVNKFAKLGDALQKQGLLYGLGGVAITALAPEIGVGEGTIGFGTAVYAEGTLLKDSASLTKLILGAGNGSGYALGKINDVLLNGFPEGPIHNLAASQLEKLEAQAGVDKGEDGGCETNG